MEKRNKNRQPIGDSRRIIARVARHVYVHGARERVRRLDGTKVTSPLGAERLLEEREIVLIGGRHSGSGKSFIFTESDEIDLDARDETGKNAWGDCEAVTECQRFGVASRVGRKSRRTCAAHSPKRHARRETRESLEDSRRSPNCGDEARIERFENTRNDTRYGYVWSECG